MNPFALAGGAIGWAVIVGVAAAVRAWPLPSLATVVVVATVAAYLARRYRPH